jgi:hypothetical protein
MMGKRRKARNPLPKEVAAARAAKARVTRAINEARRLAEWRERMNGRGHVIASEERKIANRIIDVGFKELAMKYHPDKGGTQAEMVRLNEVRRRLRNVFGHG